MANTVFKTEEPVILDGFQAVMKPSQYGYSLTAILDESYIPGCLLYTSPSPRD